MDEKGTIPDGYLSVEGGVDSGFVANLLRENELSWAINTTVRGGAMKPRPGLKYRRLIFPDSDVQANATTKLFQGAGTYTTDDGGAYLAMSVGGRIFTINVDDFKVRDISIAGDLNSATKRHAWFQKAENTLVVQNNAQAPILWNGNTTRRSVVNKQVPVGGPMAYLKGRLWVARGREFFGGDLVNTYPALGRESVLQFEENEFLNEGGAFTAADPITAMAVAANIDTQLGDGDLLIFTRSQVYAFNAPADRDTWKALRYPIQRVALTTAGAQSAESVVNLNKDLMFRSFEGINSFRYAQSDFEQWGNTPISRQVGRALENDNDRLLSEASAVNFDNRMLMTMSPIWMPGHGTIHRGLVALDYHNVSGMGRKTDPCWEGVWTGLNVLRILTVQHRGRRRCFIFALDDDFQIVLWELSKSAKFDVGPDGDDTRIRWVVESKSFTYGQPRNLKELLSIEQWYDQLVGQLDVEFYFRPNLTECWTPWAAWSACAKYRDCGDPVAEGECQTIRYFRQQVRPRMALPKPPRVVDPQTGGFRHIAYEFQFRLNLVGYARLHRMVTTACQSGDATKGDVRGITCIEVPQGLCDNSDCKALECCDPDDLAYSVATPAPAQGFITGAVFERTVTPGTEVDEFEIWSGRVGLDASGMWITGPGSFDVPQLIFWGGLEMSKLASVTQFTPEGEFAYTSVVGDALTELEYTSTKVITEVGAGDWSDVLAMPQFDYLALGLPVSLDIEMTTFVRCQPRVENLDPINPQTVEIGMQGTVVYQYPSTGELLTLPSSVSTFRSLSEYDGTVDFSGPPGSNSGIVVDPPISAFIAQTLSITDADPEWASLMGTGTADWPITGSGIEIKNSVPGPTDVALVFDLFGVGAELHHTWSYHPLEGYWVYAIADAAPWEPTGFKIPGGDDLDMASLADLGGPAGNRGEINGFGYELVEDFTAGVFKLFRSKYQVPAGASVITVTGDFPVDIPPVNTDDPFPEVTVDLLKDTDGDGTADAGAPLQVRVTAASGVYGFIVAPGSYVVRVNPPGGYHVAHDEDVNPEYPPDYPAGASNTSSTDGLIPVTVGAGETDDGNNFYLSVDP